MNFLTMVVALSLQQVLQPGSALQSDTWLLRWAQWLSRRVASPDLRAVLVLAGPAIAVYLLLDVFSGWLFGLAELLAASAVLVWSLGRDNYHEALEEACRREDLQRGASPPEGGTPTQSGSDFTGIAAEALVYEGFSRWFAPLFLFLLGGPVVALIYRASLVLEARSGEPVYAVALRFMDWLPARALVLSFAVVGDFLAVSRGLGVPTLFSTREARDLLHEAAFTATRTNHQSVGTLRSMGDLLYRCSGLWLVLIFAGFALA